MRRRFDLTPLGHPAWWGALALLLINDNLFKGRGVVPGWLAGKLSDFAFLIVAPVLLAALIPRRVPGRRTFAVLAVVGLYVATDLSRGASDAVVALAARAGLRWRLWPDPSDLLALAVLPVTVRLLRRPAAPASERERTAARRGAAQRERAGVVLGALACLATSAVPGTPHSPFLLNRTSAAADVRITWVLRKVDCQTTPAALGTTLTPSDLDDPRTMTMTSGQVAALDGVPAPGMSPVGVCTTAPTQTAYDYYGSGNSCIAAILEAPGATPVLMITPKQWDVYGEDSAGCCDSSGPLAHCAPHLDIGPSPGPDAVSLSNSGGQLHFTLTHTGPHEEGPPTSSHIQLGPIDPAAIALRPPVANGCRETRDSYHALLTGVSTCTTNDDCRAVPGLALPGEAPSCALFVNRTASTAALEMVEGQWSAMCISNSGTCYTPLGAVCQDGHCGELCAGVDLPACPSDCHNSTSYPNGTCQLYGGSCLGNDGFICTCVDEKYACAPPTPVDPSCPLACRTYTTGTPPTFDAGGTGDAGADAGRPADAAATDGGSSTDGSAVDAGDASGAPADASGQ